MFMKARNELEWYALPVAHNLVEDEEVVDMLQQKIVRYLIRCIPDYITN